MGYLLDRVIFSLSACCSFYVENLSGWAEGSYTNEANNTARQAARGRLVHHKCRV
jgi:hypothetical protein